MTEDVDWLSVFTIRPATGPREEFPRGSGSGDAGSIPKENEIPDS
jgi:hypothetical protein